MNFDTLSLPAVFLVTFTSIILLISWDWRLSISVLALQYIGVFVLVALNWPVQMAVTKLVAGWMAGAVLGMALVTAPQIGDEVEIGSRKGYSYSTIELSGRLFRLLAALMVGLAMLSVVSNVVEWLPGVVKEQALGALILMGVGFIQLGMTAKPLHVVIGLLTVLSGFEILYAALEISALVTGLLAGVNLGLALVGAYLLVAPSIEDAE